MKNSTLIRIKVPKALYESALKKALLEASTKKVVTKKKALNEDNGLQDILGILLGVGGITATAGIIAKAQDILKKKNPELFAQLQKIRGTAVSGHSGLGADDVQESNKIEKNPLLQPNTSAASGEPQSMSIKRMQEALDPKKKAEEAKKKKAAEQKKKDAETAKKDAEAKKKKEAIAKKKVADKAAADKKKAAEAKKK